MTSPEPLSCKELVDLVTEYLEGILPPDERRRFEEHLPTCQGCSTYLAQMRQTIETVGALTEELVPEEAKEELLRLFRDWRKGQLLPPGPG